MKNNVILLREDESIRLTSYIHDDYTGGHPKRRPAIIVLPGGAYSFLACNREGEPVALKYFGEGFNAFMLEYSIGEKAVFPRPLQEVSSAIIYVRRHADELNIDPKRIFVIGFSAGGHLAAAIGTLWMRSDAVIESDAVFAENKPTAVLPCYPVITSGEYGHRYSYCTIMGKDELTEEELDRYSLEKQVTADAVPAFIWHTAGDEGVPVQNSLMFAWALSKYRIPYELHVYPYGPHGMALASSETDCNNPAMNDPHVATWFEESLEFITKIGEKQL